MTKQLEFNPEVVEEINYQRYNHLVPLVQRQSRSRKTERILGE
jgi:hypothetical protein